MNPMSTIIPFCSLLLFLPISSVQSSDAPVMEDLKKSLQLPNDLNWSAPDPCQKWDRVECSSNDRVIRIQLGNMGISGTLPPSLRNLTFLQVLELTDNEISGPLPSLAGLSSLQMISLSNNQFTSIPADFFRGMSTLQSVYLDKNPFSKWYIPVSLQDATSLSNFSANNANLVGSLPEFIGPETFPSLTHLQLTENHLEGGLPASFSGLALETLWLSGQNSTINGNSTFGGSIDVLQNMTEIVQVWLNKNSFTGPIPNLTRLDNLVDLNLRDNSLTGPVPASVTSLKSLKFVNLTHNFLQGATPMFHGSVSVDMADGTNSFCFSKAGLTCDSRVNTLISFLEPFNYPLELAANWKGNDPCNGWVGITCVNGQITLVNLQGKSLSGSISSSITKLTSVQVLNLAHNNITGTIPDVLATMPNLKTLDVSYNNLYGVVPAFDHTNVITVGNVNIGKDAPPSGGIPGSSVTFKNLSTWKFVGIAVGVVVIIAISVLIFCCVRRRQKNVSGGDQRPNGVVIHPSHSGPVDAVKITIDNGAGNAKSGPSDVHVIEAGNSLVISIQVLRNATNNFSEKNVLGMGGFGTVYKGELCNGTKIAVKRMDSGVLADKGLAEFTAEIAVLTKVRHRNLVSLLGYCLDGKEKLLVYEYMLHGSLSKHLFHWKEFGVEPLKWKQRLIIALDVARGVEYLHILGHQSFIHRDLKPSNILLGDDLRAKVSDFGLVRLVPNGGSVSILTKLAGTFGYLAPEYAVMGQMTTKVDVYSFGVILMELITGRKALDETQPEGSRQLLVTWFRKVYIKENALEKAVDPKLEFNEETTSSLNTISELAYHCCADDPHQRPDMGHMVNVISSLAEQWKPSGSQEWENKNDINFNMSLLEYLEKWQQLDDPKPSSLYGSIHNAQSSKIDSRPVGANG